MNELSHNCPSRKQFIYPRISDKSFTACFSLTSFIPPLNINLEKSVGWQGANLSLMNIINTDDTRIEGKENDVHRVAKADKAFGIENRC